MIGLIVAVAGTAIISLLNKPAPQRREAGNVASPNSSFDHNLPSIQGAMKVAGNLFYSTPPFLVENVIGGKGGRPKEIREDYEVELIGYQLSSIEEVELEILWLNGEAVYDLTSTDPDIIQRTEEFGEDNLIFHSGSFSQTPDLELVNVEGAGNVPGFVGVSYILLRGLTLSRYGNSYPTVHAQLRSVTDYNLGTFLDRIIELSQINIQSQALFGINALSVASEIYSIPFTGFAFRNDTQSYLSAIQPLMEFYQLVIGEINPGEYEIKYPLEVNTTSLDVVTLDASQLLSVDGQEAYELVDFTKERVPNTTNLSFYDPEQDFDKNSVTAYNSQGIGANDDEINMPFAFSRQEATDGAQKIMRASWIRKSAFTFKVPITELDLLKLGGILTVNNDVNLVGKNWIITEIDFAESFFSRVRAEKLNLNIYNYASDAVDFGTGGTFTTGSTIGQAALLATALDVNLIEEGDPDRLGIYLGFDLGGTGSIIYLYQSDDDISYNFVGSFNNPTILGTAITTMSPASPYVPDSSQTMDIILNDDTNGLSSITETQFFAGDLTMVWGTEHIAIQNATPIGGGQYRLSRFRRGINGTESAITETKPTTVVFLKGDSTNRPRFPLPSNLVSTTQYFKFSTTSSPSLNDIDPIVVDYEAKAALPYAPVKKAVLREAGGVRLQWIPRSINENNKLITDNGVAETNVDGDSFQVDIRQFGFPTIVSTVTVNNINEYLYSNSEISADGLTGARIDFDVFQISPISGIALGYKSINTLEL